MTLSIERPAGLGATVRPKRDPHADPVRAAGASWRIEALWEAGSPAGPARGGRLPAELAARFGADLLIPLRAGRPTIAANFVSTLDGVVALDRAGATGGREISGGFEPDRFLMGLLRAAADAVLIGAGTVRASRTHAWTPRHVHPPSSAAYARWRRDLGLAPVPTTVLVTGSGDLDPGHPGLADHGVPVVIATTNRGAHRLRELVRRGHVEVVVLGEDHVPVDGLLRLFRDRGLELVLSEAGPTLFGELLAARVVDELFLTLAPQVAGRARLTPRLGLVEGVAFGPAIAPWGRLHSAMRSGDHVFLRYAFDTPTRQHGEPT